VHLAAGFNDQFFLSQNATTADTGPGDDKLTVSNTCLSFEYPRRPACFTGDGADTLRETGTGFVDTGAGPDTVMLYGKDGEPMAQTDAGADTAWIYGGTVWMGSGDDIAHVGLTRAGSTAATGSGNDVVYSGPYGGDAALGPGSDRFVSHPAWHARSIVSAGPGPDRVDGGGGGQDHLEGGSGNDVVVEHGRSPHSDDYLSGGTGNDLVIAGAGDDPRRGQQWG